MKMSRKIIVVTGTPGVGKTTISQKLANKLDANYLSIANLVKGEQLISGVDKIRKTLVADTKKVSERVQEILRSSVGNIIIDGHYAIDVVPKKEVNTFFVLRREPAELKDVLENRGFGGKKLWENLAAEILDVCLLDALSVCHADKVCEIDVSGKTVEEIVEEMVSVLKEKKACQAGIIDWLGKLEGEGRLGEFLRDF
jgi:adenylate kinase